MEDHMESRTKNTKRNVLWSGFSQIMQILFPFITRTAFIYTLGVSYLGVNGLFSSIIEVLNLTEMGFAGAIVYSMYRPIAENDKETIRALLQFYKKIYRVLGFIILTVGILLIPFLPYLKNGTCPSDVNLYIVYFVYLLNTAVTYFLFAYKKSLLIAYQRKDVTDRITCLVRIGLNCIQIACLFLFMNYYTYIIWLPVLSIIDSLICAHRANKMYPDLICEGKISELLKKNIITQTKGLFVYKLCNATRNALDNIFLTVFLGYTVTGIYSNYFYVMTAVRSMTDVITSSMSASIGNSVAVDSVEKNYNDLKRFTFLYAWISGFCTVCLACLYQPFIKQWAKEENMFPMSVVVAFCIYFYSSKIGDIRGQYTDANGLWWKERVRSAVETLSNIVLNFVLVQVLGVFGIVIATAISIVVIEIPWCTTILFDNYFVGKSKLKYIGSQIYYAFTTVCACLITYEVCSFIPVQGISEIVLKGIVCLIVPNVFYFLIFFKTHIYKESIGFLKEKLM